MTITGVTPILNVSSVVESLYWFEKLGWSRSFTWNDAGTISQCADSDENGEAVFAGVCSDAATIFLCKDAQGSRGGAVPQHVQHDDTGGVWMSWWLSSTDALDELFEVSQSLGYDTPAPPRDEPWGVREFWLRHPDGHTMRVGATLVE